MHHQYWNVAATSAYQPFPLLWVPLSPSPAAAAAFVDSPAMRVLLRTSLGFSEPVPPAAAVAAATPKLNVDLRPLFPA